MKIGHRIGFVEFVVHSGLIHARTNEEVKMIVIMFVLKFIG